MIRRAWGIVLGVVAVVVVLVVGFLVYTNIVFEGDRAASLEAWRSNAVEISGTEDGSFVITPTTDATDVGMVFVPGAKVQPSAYLYKMSGIAEATGMTIVIAHPTLNLAFFDTRPLSTFTDDVPGVDRWFVGGHSLGGVRACQLADAAASGDASGPPEVVGLMLFGSYCVDDLADSGLAVVSFVGENDGVSTPDDIAARAGNLPGDTVTVVLEGANHASFGDYGVQPGDGVATVDSETVRVLIAEAAAEFVSDVAG